MSIGGGVTEMCMQAVYCILLVKSKTKMASRSTSTIFQILVVMMIHAGHRLTGPNLRLLQIETGAEKDDSCEPSRGVNDQIHNW